MGHAHSHFFSHSHAQRSHMPNGCAAAILTQSQKQTSMMTIILPCVRQNSVAAIVLTAVLFPAPIPPPRNMMRGGSVHVG